MSEEGQQSGGHGRALLLQLHWHSSSRNGAVAEAGLVTLLVGQHTGAIEQARVQRCRQ